MMKRWMVPLFGTMAAFVLVLGATVMFASSASAAPIQPVDDATISLFHHGGGGNWCGTTDRNTLLANALGISVEQLNTAHEPRTQAIQEALNQGLITQAQADAMWNGTSGSRGFGRGWRNSSTFGRQTLLANALGISVEQLQAAQTTAHTQALQEAVAAGCITQERADEILSNDWDGTRGQRGSRGGGR